MICVFFVCVLRIFYVYMGQVPEIKLMMMMMMIKNKRNVAKLKKKRQNKQAYQLSKARELALMTS